MKYIRIVAVLGTLLAGSAAQASLTVTPGLFVHNHCGASIIAAVRYRSSGGTWMTTRFTGFNRGDRKFVASTKNSIIYYYAETMRRPGTTWAGDRPYVVDGKQYMFRRKQLELRGNEYTLTLSCG